MSYQRVFFVLAQNERPDDAPRIYEGPIYDRDEAEHVLAEAKAFGVRAWLVEREDEVTP